MFKIKKISQLEKQTFTYHFIYSLFDGIIYGILALNEFVLLKSLKGTNLQVSFLFQIPVIVLVFSIFFNELIKRTKHKKNFLNIFTVLTRIPLVLLVFFPNEISKITVFHQYSFLFILLIYFFSSPIIFPMINMFLKQAYSNENFGKLYSYATSISKITALIATFLTGYLLDINQFNFKYLYLIIAIGGIISVFILTRIKYENQVPISNVSILKSAFDSIKKMNQILKHNKSFLHFQTAFMLYGFAYLGTQGVISLFLSDELQLSYSSLAFYKNGYNTINFLLLPFFGKMISRIDPRKFTIYTFYSLAAYLFFLFITTFFKMSFEIFNIQIYFSVVIAYIFYGVFSAQMGLIWYIGSAYFCENNEVGDYQAIHLTLTGIRGVFAPLFGIYFYLILGYGGVFLFGIGFLIFAIYVLFYSLKKYKV